MRLELAAPNWMRNNSIIVMLWLCIFDKTVCDPQGVYRSPSISRSTSFFRRLPLDISQDPRFTCSASIRIYFMFRIS